jgi:hypothetical protein
MRLVLRIVKLIAVNLSICIALLVPVELIFGDWFSGRDALGMLTVKSSILYIEPSPFYPAGTMITYRRNAYGLRGPDEDPAHIDILAIGGSTTNERFLDENDTWTVRLTELLRRHDCPLSIANAGVDGASTLGHIASFDTWLNRVPGLKPRFALVYIGINDAFVDPHASALPREERYASPLRRFEYYIAAHSAVHRLYSVLRGLWQARQAGLPYGESPLPREIAWESVSLTDSSSSAIAERAVAYRRRLEQLNERIRAFGARPIYITQERMDGRQVDGTWQQVPGSNGAFFTAILDAINHETLAFCRGSGESCIDLAGQLVFQPGDLHDAIHTTASGSARIADFLARTLPPIVCPRQQS